MKAEGNYRIQVEKAQAYFLRYDQNVLIEKFCLEHDEDYFYMTMLAAPYRLNRKTGDLSRRVGEAWQDANSHSEVMTLLDLLCDSRPDRGLSHRWKNMQDFGLMFHQNLLEEKDSQAQFFQDHAEAFRSACIALGGKPLPHGDISYAIPLFDGLPMALQLWLGDEEFAPRLRMLWDANATQYLKYETMYFARGLLFARLREEMGFHQKG